MQLLRAWGGTFGDATFELPRKYHSVEPALHDLCHVVTGGFGVPKMIPSEMTLSDHVASCVKKLRSTVAQNANEVRTLAAEMHILKALGCTPGEVDGFLRQVSISLREPRMHSRATWLFYREPSLLDARRVVRFVRRHADTVIP